MAFLELDGYEVPVSLLTPTRRLTQQGVRSRSQRGMFRDSRRGMRRAWTGTACFTRIADRKRDADAFAGLVDGHGHICYFSDGLQCSTALNPLPGYGNFRFDMFTPGPFTNVGTLVSSGSAGVIAKWDAQLLADWTVGLWDNDAGWVLKTRTSDDRAFRGSTADSDVLTSADEYTVTVVDGIVTLEANSINEQCGPFFFVPYRMSDAMISGLAATTTEPGPKPAMTLSGDCIEETFVYVLGRVVNRKQVSKPTNVNGFGWVSNAELISFELEEVIPRYTSGDPVLGLGPIQATRGT